MKPRNEASGSESWGPTMKARRQVSRFSVHKACLWKMSSRPHGPSPHAVIFNILIPTDNLRHCGHVECFPRGRVYTELVYAAFVFIAVRTYEVDIISDM